VNAVIKILPLIRRACLFARSNAPFALLARQKSLREFAPIARENCSAAPSGPQENSLFIQQVQFAFSSQKAVQAAIKQLQI
jgi:hypothetical protein